MPTTSPMLKAGGNIRACRFVKLSASDNHTGLEADANERVIGVAGESTNYPPLNDLVTTYYHAQNGQPIRLHGDGDICLLEIAETIAAGDRLKSDADGLGVKIATSGTTIQHIGATALEDGASGERIRVQVLITSERPAVT